MTALILAHQKISSMRLIPDFAYAEIKFGEINRRGFISFLGVAIIILSVVAYLGAIYVSFSAGVSGQALNRELFALQKSVAEDELNLQQKINLLDSGTIPALQSMEKVSAINYVRADNFAFSDVSPQP